MTNSFICFIQCHIAPSALLTHVFSRSIVDTKDRSEKHVFSRKLTHCKQLWTVLAQKCLSKMNSSTFYKWTPQNQQS